MLTEPGNQFSITRAALSTYGRAKTKFLSVAASKPYFQYNILTLFFLKTHESGHPRSAEYLRARKNQILISILLASALVWGLGISARADDGPPVITQQPQSLELIASEDGSLSVVASGTEPLVYQWRLNGDDIPGATTATWGLNNVQRQNAGSYTVVVTNLQNAVTSAVATVAVLYPQVMVDPAAAWVSLAEGGIGGVATFSVAPLPRPPLGYQWRFNGSDLRWQTSSNLVLSVDSTAKAGDYSAWIKTSDGGVESPPVRLEVPSVKAAREQWVTNAFTGSYSSLKMVADKESNLYLLARNGSTSGFSVVKCNSSGHVLWTSTFQTPPSNADQANDIAVDDNGNVYITGYKPLNDQGTEQGYLTVKFDRDGSVVWSAVFAGIPGATSRSDMGNAVAVDGAGNVYVTGGCSGTTPTYARDYVTIKYGPDGNQLWFKRYDSTSFDEAHALAFDSATNVIVTGLFTTIKYDRDGNQLWRHDGSGQKMVIDPNDDVFIADQDRSLAGPRFPYVVYVTKMSGTNGQELPLAGGRPSPLMWLIDLLVDRQGDVFAVGWTSPNIVDPSQYYIMVTKFGAGGSNNWTDTFLGNPIAAALDEKGNVYVTGSRTAGDSQCRIVKWNNQGKRVWVLDPPRYTGSCLHLDNNFNVLVASGGTITSYEQGLRLHTLGFLPNGAFRLALTGEPAVPQWLHASTNLFDWQPLSLLQFSGGTADYTDTNAPSLPFRFFRTAQ